MWSKKVEAFCPVESFQLFFVTKTRTIRIVLEATNSWLTVKTRGSYFNLCYPITFTLPSCARF